MTAPQSDSVLARIAALATTPTPALKAMWRELFQSDPPPFNRQYLVSRLSYRIQELAFGGLSAATAARLDAIAADDRYVDRERARKPIRERPIAGTRLIREWQGIDHSVTVTVDGFEYQGRPFKSLSAVARAITGTRWNGPAFFGLKSQGGAK
ncbi:MAG: DUF2924 domain-containing protein [Azospirillum sp.]|nr:DUF2924 domain-containing protein [Azospirillum sp.]